MVRTLSSLIYFLLEIQSALQRKKLFFFSVGLALSGILNTGTLCCYLLAEMLQAGPQLEAFQPLPFLSREQETFGNLCPVVALRIEGKD